MAKQADDVRNTLLPARINGLPFPEGMNLARQSDQGKRPILIMNLVEYV
jgi:hypothetical protein